MAQLNPILGIAEGVMKQLDDLFTSDEEKAEATLKMTALLQQPHMLQAMANIEEAKHKSVFVAGLINAYMPLPAELPAIQATKPTTLVMAMG